MSTLDSDYVTVAEAAALLRVAASTIRRWIREGELPAYRIGRRRVALRREDLATLITPARPPAPEREPVVTQRETGEIRGLTPEEVQRGLAALERAERHSAAILARRGGKPFPPSWEILDETRDERTRQLG